MSFKPEINTKRIGMAGYARILGIVKQRPGTVRDIAERAGIEWVSTVSAILAHCWRARVIYRSAWFKDGKHCPWVPVYSFGNGKDVPPPKPQRAPSNAKAPSTLMNLTTTLDLIRETPMTRTEIAEELKMCLESATRIIVVLRENGLIRVASWNKPARGATSPEWTMGPGRNAPRPPQISKRSATDWKRRGKHIEMLQLMAGEKRA